MPYNYTGFVFYIKLWFDNNIYTMLDKWLWNTEDRILTMKELYLPIAFYMHIIIILYKITILVYLYNLL